MNVKNTLLNQPIQEKYQESQLEDSDSYLSQQINSDLLISIVIPVYNEENSIQDVIERIPNHRNYEIILIDDGSTDNSLKKIKEIQNKPIKVIEHQKNKGYGAAIKTGLNYCKNNDTDIMIFLDGDGQHNSQDIEKFASALINESVDFAIGNRYTYNYSMPISKKICSKILCALYYFLFRKKVSDPTNGFRAINSKIIRQLVLESDYSISQEMLFKLVKDYKFKQIPIKVYSRVSGESFIRIKDYLLKMILLFLKYYIFPKIRGISETIFSEETRKRIGLFALKT